MRCDGLASKLSTEASKLRWAPWVETCLVLARRRKIVTMLVCKYEDADADSHDDVRAREREQERGRERRSFANGCVWLCRSARGVSPGSTEAESGSERAIGRKI